MFALFLARPIRQIDAAISSIGHGQLSEPVKVQGPSDLQALGRQLEWLRVRLQDIAEERNRFLRHMSHELKTPLANIREGTELLMEGAVGSLNGEQREVAGILRDNSLRLQRLIENLLSYSEWQAKRSDLEVGEIRLLPLVKSAIETYQLPINAHSLRLDLQVPDLTLVADREKLQLILDNLISNAVKFTPDGGTITLRAAYDGAGRNLVLDVADTGPGSRWKNARGSSRRSTRAPRRRAGSSAARASDCPSCRNSCSRTAAASRSSTVNFRALTSACGCR